MSRPPDYMTRVSEALFEVMDDIGVNKRLVMKRRRARLLLETIWKFSCKHNCYMFGSQTEGSTTLGFNSDTDALFPDYSCNAIQSMREWKYGVVNYMMIQNENISPGYCHLQIIRADLPLSATAVGVVDDTLEHCVIDSEGRLLWKSATALIARTDISNTQTHGPAATEPGGPGLAPTDRVTSLFCESSPHQVYSWLQRQRRRKWPTEDVLEDCRKSGCFLVVASSKLHSHGTLESQLEWRLSSSLQERYIMFSFNIPQLMCYILMKMILKTHINPFVEDVPSSFMLKNVLLFCIANSSQDWNKGNLLAYLHLCLLMLKECVLKRNCPHFIIPDNNLLAGHMTDRQRCKLLDIIDNLLENREELLYQIQIDDLGRRLKMKLNLMPHCSNVRSAPQMSLAISANLVYIIAQSQGSFLLEVLNKIKHADLEMVQRYLSPICSNLELDKVVRKFKSVPNTDLNLLHTASELLLPLVKSTLGSVMASIDIDTHTRISDQAFTYLEAGKHSDALSGRLKHVSVLYCSGDIKRTERELTIIQTQYNVSEIHTVCTCYRKTVSGLKLGGTDNFEQYNENAIKSNVALCTRFLQCELNCVPHELRYEILRSYSDEDRQIKTADSWWMNFIVVDSLPYHCYLQYKTYRSLDRMEQQIQALINLAWRIKREPNLHHKETAYNLLGQCLEQEDMPKLAFYYYRRSLQHRRRNNAARFLLCIQLFKLWKETNTR